MNKKQVCKLFKKYGFTLKKEPSEDGDIYYTQTKKLEIIIIGENPPPSMRSLFPYIGATHKKNYGYCRHPFYRADFPKNEDDFLIILQDLMYSTKKFNKYSGKNYSELIRKF